MRLIIRQSDDVRARSHLVCVRAPPMSTPYYRMHNSHTLGLRVCVCANDVRSHMPHTASRQYARTRINNIVIEALHQHMRSCVLDCAVADTYTAPCTHSHVRAHGQNMRRKKHAGIVYERGDVCLCFFVVILHESRTSSYCWRWLWEYIIIFRAYRVSVCVWL